MASKILLVFFALLVTSPWILLSAQANFDETKWGTFKSLVVDERYAEAQKFLTDIIDKKNITDTTKVQVYSSFVMLYVNSNDFEKALSYANMIKEFADENENELFTAYADYCFGRIYLMNDLPEKTLAHTRKALKILQGYPEENYLKSELHRILGVMYSREADFNDKYRTNVLQQLYYVQKTNSLFDINSSYTDAVVMYMSLYEKYEKQEDLNKIFDFAERSLKLVENNKNAAISKNGIGTSYNNFASLINQYPYKGYSKDKRISIAKHYLDKALQIARDYQIKSLEMICYATYSELCSDSKCAEDYTLKAYNIVSDDRINISRRDFLSVYLSRALKNIYKNQNRYDKALEFAEAELKYIAKSNAKINDSRKKFIEAYSDLEQKKIQINELTAANKSSNTQKFLFLGMSIFAIIGLVFIFFTFRYRQKLNLQNTNMLEAEIKETELTLMLEKEEKARLEAEQELLSLQQEQLHKQALAVSLQLNHKNSFIQDLKHKLKNNDVNIDRLLRDDRITENDFSEISAIIHEVHPNFFKKLNAISPSKLTALDHKYAAYIYINMDNQKIANILKVDPKTVSVTKYRLKQKLGLEKDEDLHTFIQNIV